MKPTRMWFWIALAAGLFGFIYLWQLPRQHGPAGPQRILPELKAEAVTSIQVRPSGTASLQIRAERTNGTWSLVEPFVYPAQETNVTKLLNTLTSLVSATFITPAEIRSRPNAEDEFGFATPQASIIVQQGGYRAHLLVGSLTPPGDQVYLQVVAREGVYVVDAGWLKSVPKSGNEWRDQTLITLDALSVDRIAVTNNARAFVLQRDTNALWRMVWPLNAARADSKRIEQALHSLTQLQVQQFISDEDKADLEPYGLTRPDLELAIGQGTNTLALLQVGKVVPAATNQLYARKSGQKPIFTVAAQGLAPWRGASVNDFRDPHLVTLTDSPALIEITADEAFSVARQQNGSWRVMPGSFAADEWLVTEFLTALTQLQVLQFTKDVVNPPELPEFGLAAPIRKYSLQSGLSVPPGQATNCLIVELNFGIATNAPDRVFVRRTDESSVYAITTNDFARLPSADWQLQERKLWTFTEQDVTSLIINQRGKTRELLRRGDHLWSLAPGSQGIINDLAVEETVKGLAKASARTWIARAPKDLERYGLENPHRLTFVLKSSEKLELEFGATATAEAQYAAIKRGSDTYVIELPSYLYRDVANYLSIP